MAMDVSKLGIEVTSTGIKETSDALGGLSRSAGNAAKRIETLTDKMTGLLTATNANTASITTLSGMMGSIATALSAVNTAAQNLNQGITQVNTGIAQLTQTTQKASGAFQEKSKWAGTVTTTLKAMTAAALAYMGINFIDHSIKMADAWQMQTAKLKIATGSMNNAKIAQEDLFDLSQKLRVPMDELVKLFTRLAPAMRNNGKGYEDTKNMVEGLNLALQLNGSTTGEAASVMLQFSQAMQKGRLDGAEFNAIAENGSLVMRALEAETKQSSATLKKWGSEGKITFELVQRAMANNLEKWRADFASLPITVEGAFQRVKNAWMKAMGELSEQSGLSQGLVTAIGVFERLIPTVRDELVKAFVAVGEWIEKNRTGMGEWWEQIKGAAGDVFRMVGNMLSLLTATDDNTESWSRIAKVVYAIRLGVAATVDLLKVLGGIILGIGTLFGAAIALPILAVLKYVEMINNRFKDLFTLAGKAATAVGMKDIGKALTDCGEAAGQFAEGVGGVATAIQDVVAGSAKLSAKLIIGNGKSELQGVIDSEERRLQIARDQADVDRESAKMREKHRDSFDPKAFAAGAIAAAKAAEIDKKAKALALQQIAQANTDLEKQLDLYRNLASALDQLNTSGLEGKKVSAATQARNDIEAKLRGNLTAVARATEQEALATAIANQEIERLVDNKTRMLKADADYNKDMDARIAAEDKLATELERKLKTYGMSEGALEKLAIANEKYNLAAMREAGDTAQHIKQQEDLIDAMERGQAAKEGHGQKKAAEDVQKILAKMKPADFGNDFAKAFGKVGKSIDAAGKSLSHFSAKMAELAEDQKKVDAMADGPDKEKANAKLREEGLKNELDLYGDLAGTVAGYFAEKTVAHKAFAAMEKGMTIARMALTAQDAIASISASMAKAGASTVAGTAKAFEQLGVWGFAGAAAIIAFMSSMGVFGGGGSGGFTPISAEDRQKKQGTGTVLGDDTAKSESIKNSLKALENNANIGLTFTSGMAASLRNIDTKMGGVTASIARVSGMTTGKNFGINTGTQSSGGLAGLLGGKSTKTIMDTGLLLNGTAGNLAVNQYADVQTDKKSWYGKKSSSNSRDIMGVDGRLSDGINDIFTDITKTITSAGTALGVGTEYITNTLSQFVINASVSLKDLKGQDLQDALNAVFSATADDMAMSVLSGFADFQRAGEGFFETIVRVASGTEKAKDALSKLGVGMVDLMDVSNKTGDVDAELVRSSLIRQEAGTTLAHIMEVMGGGMEDLIDGYKDLTNVRNAMKVSGIGGNLSLDLIRGAGGVSELASAFSDFLDGMFSDADRAKIGMSKLSMEFGRLNLAVPATKDAFKNLVATQLTLGAAGEETAGRILALASDWSDAMNDIESATTAAADTARSALQEAYDKEAESLTNVRDKMKDFSTSLKEFADTLLTGDLSTESVSSKYAIAKAKFDDVSTRASAGDETAIGEFQKTAEEFLKFSREVNASGSGYTADFERVLQLTKDLGVATEAQATVAQQSLDALNTQVGTLLTINESVLTVTQGIANLTNILSGGVSGAAVNGSHANGLDSVPFDGYIAELHKGERVLTASESKDYATRNGNDDLCAEIAALRTEVQGLKEEQRQQTNALIASNYDAAEANAAAVVGGTKEAAQDAAYIQRTTIGLN